jgi:hypothetical protein
MIIYIPHGKHQAKQKLRMSTSQYKKWLTSKGDVIRILNLRRLDEDTLPLGEKGWVYYSPCIEVYSGKEKDHFHFIGANKQERIALEQWLSKFNANKIGYIRIVDHRRK